MNKTLFGLILCVALAVTASAAVVDLTPDNFETVVNGNKFVFVEFFAPWCGHCKNLAPEYEKFGAAFEGKPDIVIAKVDADAHKELSSKYGVTGFPTLKFFTDGQAEDYKSGRSLEDLITFVNGKVPATSRAKLPTAAPSSVTVLTPDNFDKIALDASKNVLVEFYAPWCGHCKKLAPTWDALADIYKTEGDLVIAKVDADAHKDLGGRFGVSGFPTIKYFPKGDKSGLEFDGGRELKDLVQWVNEKAEKARDITGRYLPNYGVVDALSETGRKLLKGEASLEDAKKVLDTVESATEKLYSAFYDKIQKDKNYVKTEVARLTRMLAGSLSPSKTDEFSVRLNILKSFEDAVAEEKDDL